MVPVKRWLVVTVLLCLAAAGLIALLAWPLFWDAPENCALTEERITIEPDFVGATIPPNIAPLNFTVNKPGTRFAVAIRSRHGKPIRILSRSPAICFPAGRWRKLLRENRGEELSCTIFIREKGLGWRAYRPFPLSVAREPVDRYLAYRVIKPIYVRWEDVGIWQRDLETFDQRELFNGRTFGNGCINCHTFLNNSPDRMIISTRSKRYKSAAILARPGSATRLDAKFGYASWHPSGKFIAYADMDVYEFIHSARDEFRDVIDMRSCLAFFDVADGTIKKKPDIMGPRSLETYPAWSPDGNTLYFCSAPVLWEDSKMVPPENYAKVKYSLCKIACDEATGTWGVPDTVVSANKTGLSAVLPRVSPDGKFLLFCMCEYGVFPIYQKSSDLYLLNISTGVYKRLDINSGESESWHSWSTNGRWIAFSSRRDDGEFTRTYISYIDGNGNARKPFIVPQKDPAFYETFMKTCSVPEFITGPVCLSGRLFGAAAREPPSQKATVVTDSAAQRGLH